MHFRGFGHFLVTFGALLGLILPGFPCFADSSALVIIDMQPYFSRIKKYDNLPWNKPKLGGVLKHQIDLINLAKAGRRPIVVIQYDQCGSTCAELTAAIGDYDKTRSFVKTTDGMFDAANPSAGDIDQFLKSEGITDLVIVGANGGSCARCGIEGALDKGYRVWADEQGIADFNHIEFVHPYRYEAGDLKLQNYGTLGNFSQKDCNLRLTP